MADGKLQWHPAFVAALHIEFEDEMDVLEIESEHQLGKKPMQIDILVIKKTEETAIRKNIGRIFRKYNVIEYKSPEDSLSINDFYKVYAYTCFLQSDTGTVNEIRSDDLTITYVCNHYPREMIKKLENNRKLRAVEKADGIYYLEGDEFPIQVIVTKELSRKDNYWMQNLRNDLKAGTEIESLAERYEKKKQEPYYQAVMDLIMRANWEQMEEERKMCDAFRELFAEDFKRAEEEGLKRGLEQGLERGIYYTKRILKLFSEGLPVEQIAEKEGVSVERVNQILE